MNAKDGFCSILGFGVCCLLIAAHETVMAQGETTWTHVDSETVLSGEWSNGSHWSGGVPNSGAGVNTALLTSTVPAYIVNVEDAPPPFAALTITNLPGHSTTLNISTNMDFGINDPITLRVNNGRLDVKTGGTLRLIQPATLNNLSLTIRNGGAVHWVLPENREVSGGTLTVHGGGSLTTGVSGNNFLTFHSGAQLLVEEGGIWSHTVRNLTIGGNSTTGPTILTNRGSVVMSAEWCRFAVGANSGATYVHEVVMESGVIARNAGFSRATRGLEIGSRSNHEATKGRFTVTGGVVTNLQELMIGKSADPGTSGAKIGRSYPTEGELRIYGGTWVQDVERVQVGGWAVAPVNGIDSGSYNTLKGVLTQTGGVFRARGGILVGNGPSRGFVDVSGGLFVNTNSTGSSTMTLGLQDQPDMPVSVGPGVGVLTITGGNVILDHLVSTSVVATVGSSSVHLHGGTLEILRSAEVGVGTTFSVGNGTASARMVLGDGFTGTFDEGLTIEPHALLTLGNVNATAAATITGNLVLADNARLEWKFDNTSHDLITVTGGVTLPETVIVELASLDTATPGLIPMITATGGFHGSPAAWPTVEVNGSVYLAVIDGNTLQMQSPRGSVLLLR